MFPTKASWQIPVLATPATEIELIEWLTYKPRWYLRAQPSLRTIYNGIHNDEMARVALWARDGIDEMKLSNSIKKKRLTFIKMPVLQGGFRGTLEDIKKANKIPPQDFDWSTNNWKLPAGSGRDIDIPLVKLAVGVLPDRHPTGVDAEILTQCVAYAMQEQDRDLKVSDVIKVASLHGFVTPVEYCNHDRNAMD